MVLNSTWKVAYFGRRRAKKVYFWRSIKCIDRHNVRQGPQSNNKKGVAPYRRPKSSSQILLLDRLKIQVCQEIENSIKFKFHLQKPVTYYWAGEKLKEEILEKLVNLQLCINFEELVEATRGKAKPVRVSKCHMYQIWHLIASSSQSSSPPSSSSLSKSQTSMVNEADKPADK